MNKALVIVREWPIKKAVLTSGWNRARSDEAGNFQIGGVAPGEYRVIALRGVSPGNTSNASLERALAAGMKVEVGENEVGHVRLELTELQ